MKCFDITPCHSICFELALIQLMIVEAARDKLGDLRALS